jgi:hypothetical protein
MRYATARFNQHQRDLAYRIYVTDCLRITTENTAKTVHALTDGKAEVRVMGIRFADVLENKPVDNRTADEIIDGIRNKLK